MMGSEIEASGHTRSGAFNNEGFGWDPLLSQKSEDRKSGIKDLGYTPEGDEWCCSIERVTTRTPGHRTLPFNLKQHANLLLMVTTGKCSLVRNGAREVYKAGQLILMLAEDVLEDPKPDYSFTADVLEFNMNLLGESDNVASSLLRTGHQHLTANNLLVPTLIKKIVRSAYTHGKKSSWRENAWFKVALLELIELQNPVKQEGNGLHESELNQLCANIRRTPQLNYSNSELARTLNLSLGHFVRLFRLQQGMSPREFVIQARMDKAKVLLKTTLLNISEVSEATGYRDVYHFSRQFRQKVGHSPSIYRNMTTPVVGV